MLQSDNQQLHHGVDNSSECFVSKSTVSQSDKQQAHHCFDNVLQSPDSSSIVSKSEPKQTRHGVEQSKISLGQIEHVCDVPKINAEQNVCICKTDILSKNNLSQNVQHGDGLQADRARDIFIQLRL